MVFSSYCTPKNSDETDCILIETGKFSMSSSGETEFKIATCDGQHLVFTKVHYNLIVKNSEKNNVLIGNDFILN